MNPGRPPERGQELVEFALTAALLILLVMGIVDLGRATYAYSLLHNSAREGARYGVINYNDTDGIKTTVVNRALGLGLTPADVTVQLLDVYANVPNEDTIRVGTTYQFNIITPVIGAFFGSNQVTLSTEATMRLEK